MTTEHESYNSGQYDHSHCLLCGDKNPWSQHLRFHADDFGVARAEFQSRPELQGYNGILHGGVICALLDAAMTHCLFHIGILAVTGDIQVRFLEPVSCNGLLNISARVVSPKPPLFRTEAKLISDGKTTAWAKAKFVRLKKSL